MAILLRSLSSTRIQRSRLIMRRINKLSEAILLHDGTKLAGVTLLKDLTPAKSLPRSTQLIKSVAVHLVHSPNQQIAEQKSTRIGTDLK